MKYLTSFYLNLNCLKRMYFWHIGGASGMLMNSLIYLFDTLLIKSRIILGARH